MSPALFFRLASVAVLIGIWILSFLPGSLMPAVPGSDKWHHALAYFAVMFWWGQWFRCPVARLLLAIVFIAMGAAIECLQGLTSYRSFEWLDIVADAVGVTFGWMVVTVQFVFHRRFRSATEPIRQ